jgi:hypothetical protein
VEVKARRLLLLGSWNPRQLSGFLRELQLGCGDLSKLYGVSVAIIGNLQLICGVCPDLSGFVDLGASN